MRQVEQLKTINSQQQLPVKYQKRQCTDVFCIIIGVLYSLSLIVTAACLYDSYNFKLMSFPTDSEGRHCGVESDIADMTLYPYLYFVTPSDITRRLCVTQCPMPSDKQLKCMPTNKIGCLYTDIKGFQVQYYKVQHVNTRSGPLCLPQDENLRNQIEQKAKLNDRDKIFRSIDTIYISFGTVIGLSLLYFICAQNFPRPTFTAIVPLSIIMMIVSFFCIIFYNSNHDDLLVKIFFCIAIVLLIVFFATIYFKFKNARRTLRLFFQLSTKFLHGNYKNTLLIPIFLIMITGLSFIVVLEFTAFWSSGTLVCNYQQQVYCQLHGRRLVFYSVLIAIQLLWGFTFIKCASNFCISGQVVRWDYGVEPYDFWYTLKLLFFKHVGSIIGGSFVILSFIIFDFIFDLLKPNDTGENTWYTNFYNKCWKKCQRLQVFSDLVRQDSMAYINISGNPYCNSARYTQYLAQRSGIPNYQSVTRMYRVSTHYLIVSINFMICLYALGDIQLQSLLFITCLSYFTSTLFLSFHFDSTQALLVSWLLDKELSGRQQNQKKPKIPFKHREFDNLTDGQKQGIVQQDNSKENQGSYIPQPQQYSA